MLNVLLFANKKKYFKPSGFEPSTHGEDCAFARTAIGPLNDGKDNSQYKVHILSRKVSHTDGLHFSACNIT